MQLFVGCSRGASSFTIDDMEIYVGGEPVAIKTVFTGAAEAVSYEYENDFDLSIKDGKVVCYKAGEYTVTAKTPSCSVTFKIIGKDAIVVDDLFAWVGYPASDMSPMIALPGETEVTYTSDSDIISIDGNYVTALAEGTANVTAEVGGYETVFSVTCKTVDKNGSLYYMWGDSWNWVGKAQADRIKYNQSGTDGKTTVFLGDSFFDPDFFTTFFQFYRDYDALCLGIGGTTSHQWEMFFDGEGYYSGVKYGQFAGISPKNVVVQLGNNNIYNDNSSSQEAAEDMQRFFTFLHGKLPDTQIYYFGVTPRSSGMGAQTSLVKRFNSAMGKFCENKDWIVFMDTCDEMTADQLADTIHPKPAAYKIFVDALSANGLKLEEK